MQSHCTDSQTQTYISADYMVNGIDCPKPLQYGTNLKNIELIASKYAETMHTEQNKHQFSLSILLCYKENSIENAAVPTVPPLA